MVVVRRCYGFACAAGGFVFACAAGGWGGMDHLWLFLLVQQHLAETGAFADLHAGQGTHRLGNTFCIGI